MRIEQTGEWGEAHLREPATSGALEDAEDVLGHPLPQELRRLPAETDGLEGEYGLGLLWTAERIASGNSRLRTSAEFADLCMPFDGLVFFADAGNGDQCFMSLRGNNEVYIWDHDSDSRIWVASSVLGYLEAWMRGQLTF